MIGPMPSNWQPPSRLAGTRSRMRCSALWCPSHSKLLPC